MECPHIPEVDIASTPSLQSENVPIKFSCSVCNTEQSPWICLRCGVINCGRYVNGHAVSHYESYGTADHAVCMDLDNLSVFCYKCDDFVINDTQSGHLDTLRKHLNSLKQTRSQQREKIQRRRSSNSLTENDKKRLKLDDKLKKIRPKSSGLRNLGNTCFMSAVLQSLSNIQQFCGYIKQLPSLDDKTSKARKSTTRKQFKDGSDKDVLLVEELRKTLIAIWEGGKSAISPESLLTVIWKLVPRFRGYQQQDAHEFMRYLLDRLHTELLALLPYTNNNTSQFIGPKGKSTIVTAIFGGLLQSEVNCLICGIESKKHDPFLDLSLDIPVQYHNSKGTKGKENLDHPICKLTECLSHFTEVEELEDTELYMCTGCKQKQRSTKKFWIRRLPNVLCLHLKRFKWSTFFRQKIDTFVDFPLTNLDMNKYILDMHETRGTSAGSNIYDLAAVIVHHGSGAGSGHYTAYVLNEGQWYHFNDSTVTACAVETVMKCRAYILFYIRREIRLPDYLNVSLNGKVRNGLTATRS